MADTNEVLPTCSTGKNIEVWRQDGKWKDSLSIKLVSMKTIRYDMVGPQKEGISFRVSFSYFRILFS